MPSSSAAGHGVANGADRGTHKQHSQTIASKKEGQSPAMVNLVSSAKPRSLASAPGVSFARVVFAAVQYSVSDQNGMGDRGQGGPGTSMRDSFFGLHTKPTIDRSLLYKR